MNRGTNIPFLLVLANIGSLRYISALRVNLKNQDNQNLEVQPESVAFNTELAFQNVKNGIGSVWLFHTTHNAGTSLLALFEQQGLSWKRKGRGCFIQEADLATPTLFYDDVCGERGIFGDSQFGDFGNRFVRNTSKLVTVYPIRHPIHRNMAGGGNSWETCPDAWFMDNYGLRKLIGLEPGVPITKAHIEFAKARAASFDIIADMTEFSKGLEVLCGSFGWDCKNSHPGKDSEHSNKVDKLKQNHNDIYNRWVKLNAPEIEFYEFAKKLSQRKLANLQRSRATNLFHTTETEFVLQEEEDQAQSVCGTW